MSIPASQRRRVEASRGSLGPIARESLRRPAARLVRSLCFLVCLQFALLLPTLAAETVFVEPGSPIAYVDNQTDPGLGMTWTQPGYDDSSWATGTYGVGYDDSGDAAALLQTVTANAAASIYTRTTFTVDEVAGIQNLILGVDYDDGYVAWLNGVEIYRSPEVPAGTLYWLTSATAHESSNGATPTYEQIDISSNAIPLLQNGTNVLAIGVWNTGTSSTDLVLVPRLAANVDPGLLRGPYLQTGTSDSVVVRWRTGSPAGSRVIYGSTPGSLTSTVESFTATTEHSLAVTGLSADTRYYYAIGTNSEILAGDDPDHYFITSPTTGTVRPIRAWIIGDSGNADANAASVRDSYATYTGSTHTDLWLMLGDNAYPSAGRMLEYQL